LGRSVLSASSSMAAMTNEWLEDYVMQFMKGPSWTVPVGTFVETHCSIFDVTAGVEENKFEYTDVHNEFKEIVESLLVAHLLDVDVTPDQFAAAIEANVLAAKADSRLDMIVSQIVAVGDFAVFKHMMVARHIAQQQAASVAALDASPVEAAAETPAPIPVLPSAPVAPAPPTAFRASRISSIIANAGKEKANNTDKAAMVKMALSSVRMKEMTAKQRAGA